MFVPHEIFERKPLWGVLLGVVCLGLCIVAMGVIWREYRGFAKSPEKVDLNAITPPPEMHGKWVEVSQPLNVHCEPIETENQLEHQLIFGRVEDTYFLAEISGSQRFVILQRHKKAVCADVRQSPRVGVLTELNPRLRSTLEGRGMVFPRKGLVMLLCLSCGPTESRAYLMFFPVLSAASLWLITRSWRLHMKQVTLRERQQGFR